MFGDWELTSIVQATTGYPLTVGTGGVPGLHGGNTFASGTNNAISFPNVVSGVSCQASGSSAIQWFNPAAFIAPPTTGGFYGNAGRDAFTGPGLGTWDFSVLKNTAIRERLQLQFRAEIFNLLNRANFNTPNLIVFTPPTATNPTGLSGTAGAITSTTTTARQVQFGLKLLW